MKEAEKLKVTKNLPENHADSNTGIDLPKEQVLIELKEAVNELKLIKSGKLKACPAKELLDEL